MSRFAFSHLFVPVLVSLVAGDNEAGVRKQVHVVANGLVAPVMGEDAGGTLTEVVPVRRLARKQSKKQENEWSWKSEKVEIAYMKHAGVDCASGQGATLLDVSSPKPSGLTLAQCQSRCSSEERCDCVNFQNTTGTCTLLKSCLPDQCAHASLADLYERNTIYVVDGTRYRRAGGWTCGGSNTKMCEKGTKDGAPCMIDTDESAKVNVTPTQCLHDCNLHALANPSSPCTCTRYLRYYQMTCWKMQSCPVEGHRLHECDRTDRYDTYINTEATPAPTATEYVLHLTDAYCVQPVGDPNFAIGTALTQHGSFNNSPSAKWDDYNSREACQEMCDSAGDLCKFYQWRHDPHATQQYTCITYHSCDAHRHFADGNGGNIWRKVTMHGPPVVVNGFADVGIGKCGVCGSLDPADHQQPWCGDPPHVNFTKTPAECESSCKNDLQCFGYTTHDVVAGIGTCKHWYAKNLRFGQSDSGIAPGARCHVKECVLTNSCRTCHDTPGWTSGHHQTCTHWQRNPQYCKDSGWAGAWHGAWINFPETNCCACGGGTME